MSSDGDRGSSPVRRPSRTRRSGWAGWRGGIQFHIETTPALLRQWAAEDAADLIDYDVERILTRAAAVDADAVEVCRPFADRFAAIAIDPNSVPNARPIRVSTADPITDPAEIRAALAAELQASRQAPSPLPWPSLDPPQS